MFASCVALCKHESGQGSNRGKGPMKPTCLFVQVASLTLPTPLHESLVTDALRSKQSNMQTHMQCLSILVGEVAYFFLWAKQLVFL